MPRYHINPNGEPGLCKALKQCPFGATSEHHKSADEARVFYEQVMEGKLEKPLSWLLSPKGEPLHALEDAAAATKQCFDEGMAFRKNLSQKQLGKINLYTMGGYEFINANLRGLKVNPWGQEIEDWRVEIAEEAIVDLDSAFDYADGKPRRLYRFASAQGDVKEVLDKILEAGTYEEPGYMSTSISHEMPLYETLKSPEKQNFLIEVISTKGIPLQRDDKPERGNVQSLENEYLLPRGSQFEVVGVEWRKKAFFGELKSYLLPDKEWNDKPAERKIRKKDFVTIPVLKLIEK